MQSNRHTEVQAYLDKVSPMGNALAPDEPRICVCCWHEREPRLRRWTVRRWKERRSAGDRR